MVLCLLRLPSKNYPKFLMYWFDFGRNDCKYFRLQKYYFLSNNNIFPLEIKFCYILPGSLVIIGCRNVLLIYGYTI